MLLGFDKGMGKHSVSEMDNAGTSMVASFSIPQFTMYPYCDV
jgi:hypothetical protein